MKKKSKKIGCGCLTAIIAFFVLCLLIPTPKKDNKTSATKTEQAEVAAVETATQTQKEPETKEEAKAPAPVQKAQAEKLRNPLFVYADSHKERTVQDGTKTKVLGKRLIVEIPANEFETITGAQLKDFWNDEIINQYMFVTVAETKAGTYTGQGLTFIPKNNYSSFGDINTDLEDTVNFGKMKQEKFMFALFKDENTLQRDDMRNEESEPIIIADSDLAFK